VNGKAADDVYFCIKEAYKKIVKAAKPEDATNYNVHELDLSSKRLSELSHNREILDMRKFNEKYPKEG